MAQTEIGKIINGNHRCSGGVPVKEIPKGTGQNGWDDREVFETVENAYTPAVKEEELCSHF